MITLRLFEAEKPFQQVDARALPDGDTVIGRDPSADWVIEDANGELSRKHCVLRRVGDRLLLIDTSSNGVRIGLDKTPAPRDQEHEIQKGQTIYLGPYAILVDGESRIDQKEERGGTASERSADRWTALTDAALLEQFCIGAGLEPSSFAGEDPAEVMARLGAVYRQVVDDLCDLMRDRAMMKNQLQLDRTTISARDNNPLKWAPPHSIAVELLQDDDTGFLKGSSAFRASFADLRRHGSGLIEGSKAAIQFVLAELDPARFEEGARSQPLAFMSRNDSAWKRYRQAHAELLEDAKGSDAGKVSQALRAGYEAFLDRDSEVDAA
jgi:predicted component of type VI protein secretion system